VFETGHHPVYYFPRDDVRTDLMEPTNHRTHCPYKGDASYWSLRVGNRAVENAVWSYEQPLSGMERIKGLLAFYWDKVEHWFEEDEEVFGHARDPYHRIDVRPSSREVRVIFAGETVALTRRGLFLFETGLPTRYYIPPADVRMEFLTPTRNSSTCPYKGTGVVLEFAERPPRRKRRRLELLGTAPRMPPDQGVFVLPPGEDRPLGRRG
jgi:uncharacterized protein (DUF427 family)